MSRDDELHLEASALAARSEARIVAELGPRAMPERHEQYTNMAEAIVKEVVGDRWDFHISLLMTGEPRVFMEQFRG